MNKFTNDFSQQDLLARYFGKKYGEFLYSGTLALECALKFASVLPGDNVLLPNNICYRVLMSVVRLGARPVIINPANGYVITAAEVKNALQRHQIRAMVLVHNLGLPVDVKAIRNICPKDVFLIEDTSQAWNIKSKGNSVGKFSDCVVTSFGLTKPLSLGIGGGLFSDSKKFRYFLDYYDKDSRLSKTELLPYTFPHPESVDIDKLVKKADLNVRQQQKIAGVLQKELKDSRLEFWSSETGDQPSWHRFPIWTEDEKLYQTVINLLNKYQISYEKPFKVSLKETPLAINNQAFFLDYQSRKYYYILLKPRESSASKVLKWTKAIKNLNFV